VRASAPGRRRSSSTPCGRRSCRSSSRSHLYVWEFNIRDSTVLGLIGAGGLGLLITEATALFQWGRLATVLIVVVLLVSAFDALSRRIRAGAAMSAAAPAICLQATWPACADGRLLLAIDSRIVGQASGSPSSATTAPANRPCCASQRLPAPAEGSAEVLGRALAAPLHGAELRALRSEVGQVLQGLHLVPGSRRWKTC
jgi:hypothetical protein